MADNKLSFLDDFPAISTQEWMDKITVDLKGADFNKKLVWRTTEGFNVMPFYRAEDLEKLQTPQSAPGSFPYVRGAKGDNKWRCRQEIATKDAAEANAKARGLMAKGIDSFGFRLDREQLSPSYIATLLDGIDPAKYELNFKICVRKTAELAALLADYLKSKGCNPADATISIECDPLNRMLHKGKLFPKEFVAKAVCDAVEGAKALPGAKVVAVHADSLCDAGAYCSQELGYALAWGAQYMTILTDAGISADEAASRIKFNFGIGGNYFMEIAKFRAARLLWAKVAKAYGASDEACKMTAHATTSKFNMTVFDAYVNLLRSQTEAMSAAIAGVDSITVTPFDITYKTPDDFSEHIARNQQLLLREESHFDKVVDPSAGSYYIENLTSMLADEAWKIFLAVDAEGGFYAAAAAGSVQDAMEQTAAKRRKDVATRKEVYVGTNQYPNFNETTDGKIEAGAGCGKCGCSHDGQESEIKALPTGRATDEFEALRLETENSGKRPKVFMLTIGNLAMRLARSQFSCNFFACAGYQVIDNIGFSTVEEGVEAAQKAGADIIVVCSSDDEYAEYAPAVLNAVAGRQLVVVAGAPACMEDLQKQGLEYFIHVRVNVLDTLRMFNAKLLK